MAIDEMAIEIVMKIRITTVIVLKCWSYGAYVIP